MAGSGRPVSSPAASLTKTEVLQRIPTEDLILERKSPFVYLDGQGYQHPEVPDLKVFEGLLPVPRESQNDIRKCHISNIYLTHEIENEDFVGGGFPGYWVLYQLA